jgi:hypothetical protein
MELWAKELHEATRHWRSFTPGQCFAAARATALTKSSISSPFLMCRATALRGHVIRLTLVCDLPTPLHFRSPLIEFQPLLCILLLEDHNNESLRPLHLGQRYLIFKKQRTGLDGNELADSMAASLARPRFYRFVVLTKRHRI